MSGAGQSTFAELEQRAKERKTRRERFLERIDDFGIYQPADYAEIDVADLLLQHRRHLHGNASPEVS